MTGLALARAWRVAQACLLPAATFYCRLAALQVEPLRSVIMNKQLRMVGLVIFLSLSLGFGYLQQQGWAAGQSGNGVGNKLKQLFSPAARQAFSPALALIPITPM